MKTLNTQRWFYFLLIFCISLSPVLLISCDDDDNADPAETSNDNNDNDDNDDDPSGDPATGSFNLIISGDMDDELNEGLAFFMDDEDEFSRDNDNFNPETDAGLIISITELVDDSMVAGVSVYMIQKDADEVGLGTYEVTSFMTFENDLNPVISGLSYRDGTAFISSGDGGRVKITSKSEETIEGSFDDIELFNFHTGSIVYLNGEFTANYRK